MSQPPTYNPATSFITYQAQQSWFPGQNLDVEFNNVAISIAGIRANLTAIQKDDLTLQNGIIDFQNLSPTFQTQLLSQGFVAPVVTAGSYTSSVLGLYKDYRFGTDSLALGVSETWELGVIRQIGGAGASGGRGGIMGWVRLMQPTAAGLGNVVRDYVGITGIGEALSGDNGTSTVYTGNSVSGALGSIFAANFESRVSSAAHNLLTVAGLEIDVYNASGASMRYNWALSLVANHVALGSQIDAAIAVYSGGAAGGFGPGAGFNYGLVFTEVTNSGLVPITTGGTAIGVALETLAFVTIANGVDFRNFRFSNFAFASPNFHVDGNGTLLANAYFTSSFSVNAGELVLWAASADLQLLQAAGGTGYRWALNNDTTLRLQYSTNGFSTVTKTSLFVAASGGVSLGNTTDAGANNLSVQGTVVVVDTTNATALNTGSLKTAGGFSVAQDVWIGGNLFTNGVFLGVGNYVGQTGFVVRGTDSGTTGGGLFTVQNGHSPGTAVNIIDFGNKSAVLGGAYDSTPVIYTQNLAASGGALEIYYNTTVTPSLKLAIANTAASSATTGTAIVTGGMGVSGALYAAQMISNAVAFSAGSTGVTAGGAAGLNVGSAGNFGIYFGSGAPSVSAVQGSLYLRTDGSSGTTRAYINNSAGSGTTWTAVNTVA